MEDKSKVNYKDNSSCNNKCFLYFFLSTLFVAILVGVGIFLLQESRRSEREKELLNEITVLQNQIDLSVAEQEDRNTDVTSSLSPEEAQMQIESKANQVISMLKEKDFASLANMAHPKLGVRFSPYENVKADEVSGDVTINSKDLGLISFEKGEFVWGAYDGSGEEIKLSLDDYYQEFIYDHDYANAPEISYNESVGKGNLIDNVDEVYPNAITVEYHFPGFDEKLGGMDWASLVLVFQDWHLVGIVHKGWTI